MINAHSRQPSQSRRGWTARDTALTLMTVALASAPLSCKKNGEEAPPAQPLQGQPYPQQPGYQQPGYQQPYPQQPGYQQPYPQQPGYPAATQPAPGYTQPTAPAASGAPMSEPSPIAFPCQSDAQCLMHRCNVTAGKCAWPCQTNNDCQAGYHCVAPACLPGAPAQ